MVAAPKTVDKYEFEESARKYQSGEWNKYYASLNCGLSHPTFLKRVKQYFKPGLYGELPENFFSGRTDAFKYAEKENPEYRKESAYREAKIAYQQKQREKMIAEKPINAEELPILE